MEDEMNRHQVDEPDSDGEESFRLSVLNKVKSGMDMAIRDGEVRITLNNVHPLLNLLGIKHTDDRVLGMTKVALAQTRENVQLHDFYKCVTQILQFSDDYSEEIIRKAFSVVDIDGDGSVTGADIYRLMLSLGEVISDDEILQILKSVDSDGDDRISFEDFRRFLTSEDDTTNTSLDKDITDSSSPPERCNNIPFHAKRKTLLCYRKLRAALALLKKRDTLKSREDAPAKRQDRRGSSTNCKSQHVSPRTPAPKKSPDIKQLSVAEAFWLETEDQSLVLSNSPKYNTQRNCLGIFTKKGNDQFPSLWQTQKSCRRKSDPCTMKRDGGLSKTSHGTLTPIRKQSNEIEHESLFVRGRSSSIVPPNCTTIAITHQTDDVNYLETSQNDNQDPGRDTNTGKADLLVNQGSDAAADESLSPPSARKPKYLNVYITQDEMTSSQNSSNGNDLPVIVPKRCISFLPESYNDPSHVTASNDSMKPSTCRGSQDVQSRVYRERTNMAGFRITTRHERNQWKASATTSKDENLLKCTSPKGVSGRSHNSFSRRLERQTHLPPHRRKCDQQNVIKASFLTLEFPAENIHTPRYKCPSLLTQLPVCSHRRKNLPTFLG